MVGICRETGREVVFRSPDDDYRTDACWRYDNDARCVHRIDRVIVVPVDEPPRAEQ